MYFPQWHACCNIHFTQKNLGLVCNKQQDYFLFDGKGKHMSTYINLQKNLLIDALGKDTQRRLFPHHEIVKIEQGTVIS
jgi:hypothetical protein